MTRFSPPSFQACPTFTPLFIFNCPVFTSDDYIQNLIETESQTHTIYIESQNLETESETLDVDPQTIYVEVESENIDVEVHCLLTNISNTTNEKPEGQRSQIHSTV